MYASVFECRYGEYLTSKYHEAKLITKYLDHLVYIVITGMLMKFLML